MTLFLNTFASPIGPLTLASDGRALVALAFGAPADPLLRSLRARFGLDAAIRDAADPQGFTARMTAYFAGELAALSELPVDGGGSPFQRQVWAALRRIPPGETVSYSALAACIGAPRATRAVGLANGQNPIAVVVPCHRVIGADGSLTGYGGGLERKRWLIEHERRWVAPGQRAAIASRGCPGREDHQLLAPPQPAAPILVIHGGVVIRVEGSAGEP